MAVLVFAGAAFNSVSAQSKKKDKKNKQKTECTVECKKKVLHSQYSLKQLPTRLVMLREWS